MIIFRLANGDSRDRAGCKYCIQDCNLVHHLMSKVDVMTGYVEMSRICSVPISYLCLGQGIKLTSFVAKSVGKNTLMPDLEKSFDNRLRGCYCITPKCSLYMDKPVACGLFFPIPF
jgi:Na+-translocating ferredoxin:NAD+ oxidoreductase RNF subunit RnfB